MNQFGSRVAGTIVALFRLASVYRAVSCFLRRRVRRLEETGNIHRVRSHRNRYSRCNMGKMGAQVTEYPNSKHSSEISSQNNFQVVYFPHDKV